MCLLQVDREERRAGVLADWIDQSISAETGVISALIDQGHYFNSHAFNILGARRTSVWIP